MIGMGGNSQSVPSFELKYEPPSEIQGSFMHSRERRKKLSEISQRQLRKNKRRKHAAGFKNAFRK
jgi:hypothetical protein